MVEPNTRDDADFRFVDNVRGIQPAAQAYLQNHDLALLLGKVHERHGCHELDFGRVVLHGVCRLFDLQGDARQVLAGYARSLHANALFERKEVRAGEQACFVPDTSKYAFRVRADRPLPVRSRHMHEPQFVLRVPQAVQQLARPLKAHARFVPSRLVDVRDRVKFAHAIPPCCHCGLSYGEAPSPRARFPRCAPWTPHEADADSLPKRPFAPRTVERG